MQVSTLGIMPPVIVPSAIRPRISSIRNSLMSSLFLSRTPGNVGQEQETLGPERAGDGAGEGIGVDVVGLAIGALRDRRQDRDQFAAEDLLQHSRIHLVGLADEAEIDSVFAGGRAGAWTLRAVHHVAVLAAKGRPRGRPPR